MRLYQRDIDLIHFVGHFGQADFGHMWTAHFYELKSRNSLDQVLSRLTKAKYLHRMGQRMVKGDGVGSGKTVYQLGTEGIRLITKRGADRPRYTSINEHALTTVDAYIQLVEEERKGRLRIIGYLAEPESHMRLGGVTVRPDLYVEVELTNTGEQLAYWLEIDRDTEGPRQVGDMVRRYTAVFDDWQEASKVLDPLPRVLFLSSSEQAAWRLQKGVAGLLGVHGDVFLFDQLEGWAERVK